MPATIIESYTENGQIRKNLVKEYPSGSQITATTIGEATVIISVRTTEMRVTFLDPQIVQPSDGNSDFTLQLSPDPESPHSSDINYSRIIKFVPDTPTGR